MHFNYFLRVYRTFMFRCKFASADFVQLYIGKEISLQISLITVENSGLFQTILNFEKSMKNFEEDLFLKSSQLPRCWENGES